MPRKVSLSETTPPCISVCQMGGSGDACAGCHRSQDAITEWLPLSPVNQQPLLQEAPQPGCDMGKPDSPCIGICQLDETSGLCIGCYRSREEITAWAALDDRQRQQLMLELPSRVVSGS